ncbi:MAG: TrkA family potassium uptake protein [Chlamydiota bacterium]|nr:TrkA family potassium uptake protein [Chlamydiota bacterium]
MKQAVVIGLGRFGFSVAKTLSEHGWDILAIDRDLEKVQEVRDFVAQAVQANAQDEKTLRALGVQEFGVAIVSIGNEEQSILVTMLLKEMGLKEVLAKAVTATHAKVLERVGANRIIFPEKEMGVRLATSLVAPDVYELISVAGSHSIAEVAVPSDMVGKALKEAELRGKYHVMVIGVKSRGDEKGSRVKFVPDPKYVMSQGDTLIILGTNEDIANLRSS